MCRAFAGDVEVSEIVIPIGASEPLRLAASDLRRYLRLALGQELPICEGQAGSGRFFIHVGQTGKTQMGMPHDRSEVFVRDGCVWVAGQNERSALYAVYDFLKAQLGVRFYGPGDSHEFVPRHSELRLEDDFSLRTGSAFPIRNYYIPSDAAVVDFYAKNRLNMIMFDSNRVGDLVYEDAMTRECRKRGLLIRGPGHNWRTYIPDKAAFDEHPEYLPMQDGKRIYNGRTACFSNPKVREIFMAHLRNYLRTGPQWDVFAFWSEDVFDRHYCTCPECSKRSLTDWYFLLANEAAAVLEQERPEAVFEFIVYQATCDLPSGPIRFHQDGRDMIWFYCGGQTRDTYHPFLDPAGPNAEGYGNYRMWSDYLARCGFAGQKLLMEYYNLCEWQSFGPRGKALLWPMETARADAEDYLRDGWAGFYNCDCFDRLCWPVPFYHWCWLQLYHDPLADVAALRREFFVNYFGSVASDVAAYVGSLEQVMHERTTRANIQAVAGLAAQLEVLHPADAAVSHRVELLRVHHEWCVLVKELFLAIYENDQRRWLQLEQPYRAFWDKHRQVLENDFDVPPMFAFNLYEWYLSNPNASRTPQDMAGDARLH